VIPYIIDIVYFKNILKIFDKRDCLTVK